MDGVDPRAFEFAISQINDGFVFESFAQSFISGVMGYEFVPIGGIHDRGIDGLEHTFQREGYSRQIYQLSRSNDAQSVINNKSIDAETRAIIRYGLETNDPWLGDLVRRADAGETIIDNLNIPPTSEEKIEALAELICRAGDEASAALLVPMATLENAPHPKALANTAKHFAFTRCVESNLYGMVDAQIAMLESELLIA